MSVPASAGVKLAARDGDGVMPLAQFVASVRAAQYRQYVSGSGASVADNAAFAEMKAYIVQRYENIDVRRVRDYVTDSGGSVFDCLPQPDRTVSPPTPPGPPADVAPGTRMARQGPRLTCPDGTIPVQRITLETLVRFPTLGDFFHK